MAETLEPEQRQYFDNDREQYKASIKRQSNALFEAVGEQRTLLYIDNFESLLTTDFKISNKHEDLATFIYTLLKSASNQGVTLLLTSQRPPAFTVGHVQDLIKTYPPSDGLGGLPEDDALSLLRKLDANNEQGIKQVSEEILRSLISRCGGNPLVFEAILSVLNNEGASYLLADLIDDEKHLQEILENPIKALFDGQSKEGQDVLKALAIYRAAVPKEALSQILQLERQETHNRLSRLERNYAVLYDKENKIFSLRPSDQQYIYAQIPATERPAQHLKAAAYFYAQRKDAEDIRAFVKCCG